MRSGTECSAPSSPPPSSSEEETLDVLRKLNSGDGEEEEEQVMSEVHLGCPPGFSGPYISHFTIYLSHGAYYYKVLFVCDEKKNFVATIDIMNDMQYLISELTKNLEMESLYVSNYLDVAHNRHSHELEDEAIASLSMELDEDGDLVLPRRAISSEVPSSSCSLSIQHNITSSIPNVGLQIWRAELLLSDFVLHKIVSSSEFHGAVALELGAGTGMVGLLLARCANTVFLTDHGIEILENCAKNVQLNAGLLNCKAAITVRELDWFNGWPPEASIVEDPFSQGWALSSFSWTFGEIEQAENASFLLAADVIYSDDLTDAFFSTLKRLMSRGSRKVLYMALEKRYNFSLSDLDVVANGYSHFRSYLKGDNEMECPGSGSIPFFVGKQIDIAQIPQYVREYERGHDVELWEIKYCEPKQSSAPEAFTSD